MKKLFTLFVVFTLASLSTFAQLNVKFEGELRTRLEIDDLDFNANTGMHNYINNRARLSAIISNNDDLEFVFRIIDARVFGFESSFQANSANLDLNEAYLKIKKNSWEFILGRQQAKYNNGRLVGYSDWGNTPITFDGATVKYYGKGYWLSAFAFRLADRQMTGDSLDQNLFGIFSEFKFMENFKFNPYIMFDRKVPVENLARLTLGFNATGYFGPLIHDIDFAYQTGNITLGRNLDVSAIMAAINLEFDFRIASKAALGAGFGYYSGDKDAADNKYEVFDNSYATKHAFLGEMDYLKAVPAATYNLGITDMYAYYKMALAPWLAAKVTGHLFNSATAYKLASGTESNAFGTEIDLGFIAKYNEYLNFNFGASTFLPGDIFKEKKGKDNSYWFYAGFHLNFK